VKKLKSLFVVWKIFGSAKFAITILLLFTFAMIIGTIIESVYGTHYAVKVIYFSWWFYTLQFYIFSSLVVAVIDRLPFRPRLLGFYVVHAAIVTILIGTVITKINGIDGQLIVRQKSSSNYIKLNENLFYFSFNEKLLELKIPDNTFWKIKNTLYEDFQYKIELKELIPYAKSEIAWVKSNENWNLELIVKNNQIAEKTLLSYPANSIYDSKIEMGPLKIKLLNNSQFESIKDKNKYLILVNGNDKKKIFLKKFPQEIRFSDGLNAILSKTIINKSGVTFYELSVNGKNYKFFPKYSSFPIKEHLEVDRTSIFQLKSSEEENFDTKATVFVSKDKDNKIYFAYKKNEEWKIQEYLDTPIVLPWMGLHIDVLKQRIDYEPKLVFSHGEVQKEDEKNIMAAQITIYDKSNNKSYPFWISDQIKGKIKIGSVNLESFIAKKMISLPFSVSLENFKMDMIPGTQDPASYESFVDVEGEKYHIYMNHPLKKSGFTLYQSSYFQDDEGNYNSILSVNKDPGRAFKYLGSLLLVCGLILHYLIVYKKVNL
jgi:hypothetical protein